RSLEKEFKQLREDALSQESAFQSEIEQYQNEKDKLGEQLHDVEHKIVDLNAALQKNCNEGVELLAVKQNVEKRFKEKLEKQKREVENAVRGRMEEIKRQCHLTALEIVQYELMLKKAHEENMELCYRFYKVDNSLQSVKFATEEPANFQSQLKEKLGALVKKFRNEANNSKKKMMMYVLNNFEAAVKVILSDEPHFCYLIKSGIALAFAGNEEINEKSKITIANSGRKEKSDRKEKKKALMDCNELTSQIYSLLEFYQKRAENLTKNVWHITNRVGRIEQIMKRVGDSSNILTMNECTYSISQNMRELEDMNKKFEILHKETSEMCQKIRSEIWNSKELEKLMVEGNRLVEICKRIAYKQQELGIKQVNAELKYGQLRKQILAGLKVFRF
ncbi:hypothetical protein WUBG_05480, partial [Wuchereria bancrofti]